MSTPQGGASAWIETADRLKQIEADLAETFAPNQRVIDEIYRRRARQLAERRAAAARVSTLAVLVFGLGQERYAIELSEIAEVVPYSGCSSVPGAPPALLGVLNLRGDIKSVADLKRLLGLEIGEDSATGYVLFLRRPGRALGFKVDRIDQVQHIDPAHLLSTADGASPIPGLRHIKALTRDTVMLIDTSAALAALDSARA
jgi:purine-binding chemotaxis protein CheW